MSGDAGQAASLAGAVPRIEYQQAHRDFLGAVRPPTAMMNLVHVRRALKNGHTADSLFPERTTVVTTTTVADNRLARLLPDQEVAMIRAFGPDYHVPTDFPVYGEMDADRRRENVRRVAAGTRKLAREVDATVLPLIKGTTPAERAVCERVVADLDPPAATVYATQYTTVPSNRQFPAIRERLSAVEEETDGHPVLVIGYMNPDDPVQNRQHSLRAVPESVVAAAGLNQWVRAAEPRGHDPAEMRAGYADLHRGVREALDAGPAYDPEAVADAVVGEAAE